MSSRSYKDDLPPPLPPRRYIRRRSGVLGANEYNYQYNNRYNNQYNNRAIQYNNRYNNGGNRYNNRDNIYYRRNVYYNRNYRPQQRYLNDRPQGRYNQSNRLNQQRQSRSNRPSSRNNRQRSRSNRPTSQNNRQRSRSREKRRRGPRQLILNDYMPAELRDSSPGTNNLPADFNLATATTTAPPDALPQRERFARNNTTQPFVVDPNGQDNRQPQPQPQQRQRQQRQNQRRQRPTTTSSHRRQQSRNNRFAVLADQNDDPIEIEINNEPMLFNTNKKDKKTTKKTRQYLEPNRILNWLEKHSPISKKAISGRGNQAYAIASAPVYDDWVRNNYEVQVWKSYLKLATEKKHWAKEVVQRTKRRDNIVNTRFVQKKINRLNNNISEASATISDLQVQLSTYWMHTSSEVTSQRLVNQITSQVVKEIFNNQARQATTSTDAEDETTATTATATINTAATKNHVREPVDRIERCILDYIQFCTQHVKKMAQTRIELAKAQLEEYKALEDFQQIATPAQWNIHLILKPKIKLWSTKNKNFQILTKRVELDLLPKTIDKVDFSFRVDESIINQDEAQATYDQMRQINKEFRVQAMKLYVQSAARENEILSNEIKRIIEKFPKEKDKDDSTDAEEGHAAFEEYNKLPSRGQQQQQSRRRIRWPDSGSITGRGFLAPEIINQAQIQLNEEEHQLLKLGPKFIFNDPKTAARRRTIELTALKRKIENRFFQMKVSPGRPLDQFIAELNVLLQTLHNGSINNNNNNNINNLKNIITIRDQNKDKSIIESINSQASQSQLLNRPKTNKKRNYGRLVKRLKYKFKLANIIIQKSDKSKVFHLGKIQDYHKKSEEYMEKTQAYKCLGTNDPLPDLVDRTNKYLLDLRLAKWITQKQYELLSIKLNEVELAHLYYLPKAHKAGTPLRPIISGLKHPTIKISKFLDDLLRPLFDQMAQRTTITSGFELVKELEQWSLFCINQQTIFCTIDVADLYTMIPQIEGVLSLKKMLDYLKIKQVNGLKLETIIRLGRFVMQNNYFYYNGQYYQQIRGGAMGSPLTLTMANCYMFFFERPIAKQVINGGGLYYRYIDDLFITINWPARHLLKQIERWNQFDKNIKLNANIGSLSNFLDLHMENKNETLFTKVYQKPSYEPYYLPFNSIHPLHMKKNIPFTMLLRAIRYCSTFEAFLDEREKLRMALLLNKYPNKFIEAQFNNMLVKFKINEPLTEINYKKYRQLVIDTPYKEKAIINYDKMIFVHFTYCSNMRTFPSKFHAIWDKYFGKSPINEIMPILGTKNVNNLQRRFTSNN